MEGRKRNRRYRIVKRCMDENSPVSGQLEWGECGQEKRAYIQRYTDCIQVLFHMGLLKENEGLKWAEEMEL